MNYSYHRVDIATTVKRHPVSRINATSRFTHLRVVVVSAPAVDERIFQVSQSIAPPLYVDDMCVVQQVVENRCCQRLITGQQLGPVSDALVGRDQDRTPTVAVTDQSEEQARLFPVHRLEAQFVDIVQQEIEVLMSVTKPDLTTTPEPGRDGCSSTSPTLPICSV